MLNYEFKYRKYAEALYNALQDNAFYITMEKSIDNGSSKEAMIRYMDYSIIEGEQYGEIFLPEDHDYGVSVWGKPLNKKLEKEKNKLRIKFDKIDHSVLTLISDQIWKEKDVDVAGFKIDHPEIGEPVFMLKTKRKDAKSVWNAAIDALLKENKELEKELSKIK